MASSVITLSGWGQPHDALDVLAPGAHHLDYSSANNMQEVWALLAKYPVPELAIGWSLGGQLLLRAMDRRIIRPQRLVLIAPPFQFVQRAELPLGMPAPTFALFRNNYARHPERTLRKAWELIARGDAQADTVSKHLEKQDKTRALSGKWLDWLDILAHTSLSGLDFSGFPPILLVHGERDLVVSFEQSKHLEQILPHATLVSLPTAGHAPHWHDPALIRRVIADFMHA